MILDGIDTTKFEKNLIKDIDSSEKTTASDFKSILKGKYLKFDRNHMCIISEEDSSQQHPFNLEQSIPPKDLVPSTVSHTSDYQHKDNSCDKKKENTTLPPIHDFSPLKRPRSDETIEIKLPSLLKSLLQIEEDFSPPLFRFDISEEAANHNWNILQRNDLNLDPLLNPQRKCITSYGSEFKSSKDLAPLLNLHPRWSALKTLLDNGSDFPLTDLEEDLRRQDLEAAYIRGNHKSAQNNEVILSSAISKEISKGWMIILPDSSYDSIPDLVLNPMGIAEQIGVGETGEFIPKKRVTHDLSFPGAISNESINSRVLKEHLEPCMFGHALIRIIHHIVNLRRRFPSKRIWIRKEDFKSAYRRIHINAITAKRSAVRVKLDSIWYIIISARLPFGGSPCPNDFCLVSDVVTDTINDLLACNDWNHEEVHSDYFSKIPQAKSLDPSIKFAQSRDLSVTLPDEDYGKADCFVDDIISCCVDINDNLGRLMAAPCTVIHALAHKCSSSSYVKRDNLIADDKNEAEGGPEEIKICLGWQLDTRRLLVSLPDHKHKAWSFQITELLKHKTASEKVLASILGRLENVTTMIAMMGHFLSNIRHLQIRALRSNHNVKISQRVRNDLDLACHFLTKANRGISMNLITFRSPTVVHIGDASEHGLGSFASHGRAWSYTIPMKLRGRAHINLLEFLTQVISIWIDVIENKTKPEDCILCMGDNTSAMGWLRRSNFREKDEDDNEWEVKQEVARKMASLVLKSDAVLYTQWFAGKENDAADSLSRDCYYLSNKTHKHFLLSTIPHQLPQNFNIRAVPAEICSFISSTLEQLPVKKLRLVPQKPSELARGNVGILSCLASGSTHHSTSMASQNSNRTSFCPPSAKPLERPPSLQEIKDKWWKEQSQPPCHMWHRPSGQTTGRTPDWTKTVRLASSYKNNTGDTGTKMEQRRNKKPSPSQ